MKHKTTHELFWRVWAYILDFLLAYSAYYYLISFEVFKDAIRFLSEIFNAQLASAYIPYGMMGLFISFLFIYLLCASIRVYSTILFGVSLGQLLVGLRSQGSLLRSRLGGTIRVILDTVLSPIIIFELPVLRGMRSLSEKLTFTRIKKSSGPVINIFVLIATVLIFTLAVVSPLLENLTLIDGVKVNFTKSHAARVKSGSNFALYKQYRSERFKMESFSSLGQGTQKIIPTFELTKHGRKTKIVPYFNVYDVKRKSQGSYTVIGKLSLLKLIKLGKTANPLFSKNYPALVDLLERTSMFKAKKYEKEFKDKKLLSFKVKNELKDLIQTSFELSFGNIFSIVQEKGPFLRGYVLLRNRLVGKVQKGSIPLVDFVKMGNYEFLRLRQDFGHLKVEGQGHVVTYIPIETLHSIVLRTIWGTEEEDKESEELFLKDFLSAATWYFDYTDVFKNEESVSEFGPFQFLDYFLEKSLDQETLTRLEDFTFRYFYELGRDSFRHKLSHMRESLVTTLKRIIYIANFKNKQREDYFSSRFMNNMNDLTSALESDRPEYFNLSL